MNSPDRVTTDHPITAVLSDAAVMEGLAGRFLVGDVSYDIKDRWPNGTHIHTSYIIEELGSDTFRTRAQETFKVVSWKTEMDPIKSRAL